jgi:hypothetical protein
LFYFIILMRSKLFIIPTVLIFQLAAAQTGTAPAAAAQEIATTPVSASSAAPVTPPASESSASSPVTKSVLDFQSVYETATVEEEVKLAAERFELTKDQQNMWMAAATERRETESQARVKIDSKASNYDKEGAYRGLRSAQNTFYETIIGHLAPAQKQALETDRLIMQEKQKKLAKLPPPPPPAPTVTVAPVDSAAIKAEKDKKTGKKPRKKRKPVGQ